MGVSQPAPLPMPTSLRAKWYTLNYLRLVMEHELSMPDSCCCRNQNIGYDEGIPPGL
jgi:hypothetical protein